MPCSPSSSPGVVDARAPNLHIRRRRDVDAVPRGARDENVLHDGAVDALEPYPVAVRLRIDDLDARDRDAFDVDAQDSVSAALQKGDALHCRAVRQRDGVAGRAGDHRRASRGCHHGPVDKELDTFPDETLPVLKQDAAIEPGRAPVAMAHIDRIAG